MILIQSIFMKIYSSLYKITNCCVKCPINVGPPFITFKNSLILSLLIQNKDVQRMWFGEVRVCSWVNIFPAESLFTWESCTNPIINIVHLFIDPYKLPCFVEWSLTYFLFQHLLSLEVWKYGNGVMKGWPNTQVLLLKSDRLVYVPFTLVSIYCTKTSDWKRPIENILWTVC